jgi:NAD-dependent dihydropyrimidine dehydrogenase PreA subunit
LVNDQIEVKPLGCIGCGMCQQDCPTTPRAITVIPKAAREH